MPKPNLIKKPGNVYHTPVANPPAQRPVPSNVNPITGEVIGAIMEQNSQENVNTWWEVFTEIGRETVEIQRRHRQPRRKLRQKIRNKRN